MPHAGLHWRIWAAEAIGTGLFVLGALSIVALHFGAHSPVAELLPSTSARFLLTGLLVGAVVSLIAVSPLGRLSGAHLNPAVTVAFRVLGMVSGSDVVGYVLAQLAGGLAGGLAFRALWGSVARSVDGGVTHPTVSIWLALALEAAMTAVLIATIFLFLAHRRLARFTPPAVLALIALLIWKGAPYTGTSLNPARSEGPAVAFEDYADLWLYLVAPLIGALAVALAWRGCRPGLHPLTAKLFHDRRYPCSLASALPALAPDARAQV